MAKTLVLMRHGHRIKLSGGAADNGLSPKGRKQAMALARWFGGEFGGSPVLVACSPKKRCIETVAPITRGRQATTALIDELDEDGNVNAKARRFARWWKSKAPTLTVVCSHGDILPSLVEEIVGGRIRMSKGACAVIEYDDGDPRLSALIQSPG